MGFVRDLIFGRPPPAPDYAGAAAQQGQWNLQAARTNARLNRINENTPYGSVQYRQVRGADGELTDRWRRTVTLSPEQQRLYDLETGNQIASQRIAQGLQGQLRRSVRDPFQISDYGQAQNAPGNPRGQMARRADLPNQQTVNFAGDPRNLQGPNARDLYGQQGYAPQRESVEESVYDRFERLQEPQMQRQTEQLDLQLRNQGLMPGTEAYDSAMQQMRQQQDQTRADARDRAIQLGGAEQSRLAGIDLAADDQRFQQQQQGYGNQFQEMQAALANRLSTAGFNNQTRRSEYEDMMRMLGFNNEQQANRFARGLQQAGFNNQNRSQRIQEGLLQRQQPLSEYNAFRTGNTPSLPQFQPYGQVSTQAGNIQGATQAAGQYGIDRYNAGVGGMQSLLNFGSSVYAAS